jgi:exopolysaccharide biosynthesis polyprenyl glycosylphosphotransferase
MFTPASDLDAAVASPRPTPSQRRLFRAQGRWWRDALLRRLLALADLVTALLAALAVGLSASPRSGIVAALLAPAWILLAKLHGLYDRDHRAIRHLTADELPRIVLWALTGSAATAVALSLAGRDDVTVTTTAEAWAVASGAAYVARALARIAWRTITPPERTVIIGDGPLADATRRKLQLFPDTHMELVDGPFDVGAASDDSHAGSNGVERVILAFATLDEERIASFLGYCRQRQIKLSVVPPVRGMFGTAAHLSRVADLPVVEFTTWDVSRSTLLLKRALDVVVSSSALVVLAPLFLAIAVAIRLDSRGPTFFTQRRAGVGGRPFRMFKFRTMVANAEELLGELVPFHTLAAPMFKLANDPRVTRVGRVLRRTSIDELPQLLNVLRGEMSLVGPRPEQVELVERYDPEQRFRLAVKPGLTGPMQVYGRGQLTFEERLAVEREYIENLSLRRDLHILALTIPTVFSGRGAF